MDLTSRQRQAKEGQEWKKGSFIITETQSVSFASLDFFFLAFLFKGFFFA